MKPVKKLAVLVGGEFREFENAHKSWKFLNDVEYDLFISTWDMSYELNPKLNINLAEKVTSDRITKYFPNAIINIQPDFNVDIESSFKMLHHWKMLYNMLIKSEYDYDTILLTRPDIKIKENDSLSEFINNILDDRIYGLGSIDQLPPPDLIYVNDVLFLGKDNMMKKLLSEFSFPKNLDKSIHYHLSKFFINNDIYIDKSLHLFIEFFIMRSIHRKSMDETFEREIEICNEWWEAKHLNK